MNHFYVVRYRNGKFIGVISGLGRNRNTWDAAHSKRTAHHYARQLNREYPEFTHKVEGMVEGEHSNGIR